MDLLLTCWLSYRLVTLILPLYSETIYVCTLMDQWQHDGVVVTDLLVAILLFADQKMVGWDWLPLHLHLYRRIQPSVCFVVHAAVYHWVALLVSWVIQPSFITREERSLSGFSWTPLVLVAEYVWFVDCILCSISRGFFSVWAWLMPVDSGRYWSALLFCGVMDRLWN